MGEGACAVRRQAEYRVSLSLQDLVRAGLGNDLYLDAALGAGHRNRHADFAVHDYRQIELAGDVARLGHHHLPDNNSFRRGLRGHERPAKHPGRGVCCVFGRVGQLYAASLASPASVNLRLYYHLAADVGSDLARFVGRCCDLAAGHRYAVVGE